MSPEYTAFYVTTPDRNGKRKEESGKQKTVSGLDYDCASGDADDDAQDHFHDYEQVYAYDYDIDHAYDYDC